LKNKLLLIINKYSGHGVTHSTIGELVTRLSESGFTVTVMFTEKDKVAQLAFENASLFDLYVCCGGDGTLSDVVSGLVGAENAPPIGYIPMGTANDIATTLALSRNIEQAVNTISEGYCIDYDVGLFRNDLHFTYIAAFGMFTELSYATPQSQKKILGHFAYVLGGFSGLSRIKQRSVRVEYDNGVLEDDFIYGGVMNSRSVAGLVTISPEYVDLSDGLFEVILLRKPMNIAQLSDILSKVFAHKLESDAIVLLHTSKVKFTFDEPVAWTRDGESGGDHSEVEITNIPRAVRLIVPKQTALQPES